MNENEDIVVTLSIDPPTEVSSAAPVEMLSKIPNKFPKNP